MIQDSESLDLYLRDIASSEPLSSAEEIELAKKNPQKVVRDPEINWLRPISDLW